MTQLVVESNGVSVALDPRRSYRVGRDPGADIVVSVDGVSRTHAVLRFEGGQWILEDAGSANGTYDGGRRVQRLAVAPGSQVRLGHPEQGVPVAFRAAPASATRAEPGTDPAAHSAPAQGGFSPHPPGQVFPPPGGQGQAPPPAQQPPVGYPGQAAASGPQSVPPPYAPTPGQGDGTGAMPPYQQSAQGGGTGTMPPYQQPAQGDGTGAMPPYQQPAGDGTGGMPPYQQPAQGGIGGMPPYQQPTQVGGTGTMPPYQQPAQGAGAAPPYQQPAQGDGTGGMPPYQQPAQGGGTGTMPPYDQATQFGGPGSMPPAAQGYEADPIGYQPTHGTPPPRAPMPTMSGQYREPTKVRNLGGQQVLRIGRAPENDMVVADLRVSRQHAELRSSGGTYELVDVGSRSGTYVNGQRVERAIIGPNDIIGIGPSTFHLVGDVLTEYTDTGAVNFSAHDLTVTVDKGKVLLDHVSFPLGEKCLVAVIGPSGSGKSTLLRALTGLRPADQGTVSYDGRDLYRDYSELRSRIGLVPQDDILHTQLTVRRALIYAAELRFPDDTRQHERKARVDEVLKELGLDHRRDNKISALSGGQRKRVSVALELLTKPSLLFLDEPTSGLDPGLDKSVMQMLRGLADDGRTVAVVTHSVANLDICDRLLVMAPGGRIAFFGPPKEALPFLGFTDWADVFQAFDDPSIDWGGRYRQSPAHQKYVTADLVQPVAQAGPVSYQPPPKPQSWPEQLSTLIRRYIRSIAADPLFLGITVALPIIMGAVARVIPAGDLTSKIPGSQGGAANLLMILCIGGCLTGAANAVRELVKERPIYQRERAVGLSRSAYLTSKLLVLGVITIGQGIVLTLVAMLGVNMRDKGVVTSPMPELIVAVALLSFTAMTLGLLISAIVKTSEMTMPLLVLTTLVQIVFCGALVHLDGKAVLEEIAWIVPARWAFAAMAGTLDISFLLPHKHGESPDPLWKQQFSTWLLDMGMMVVLTVVLIFLVERMLRRQEPEVMRKR
ncbi:FHA domain-containing protein [Actinoallomurus iriomotensis]|uniref:ABC transporter ATP-binding protein n=1 Tax=Actinoallomurus iriomotensis TaxID=478107 RepID=A0A9W6S5F2_9ACTN|nr:FHA domain-containing protein [Actinoallomurus iriomotensis]GLY87709.1 ABC transporter ATP-binding protein [Actinoallomurus iriomotensis]